MENIKIIKKQRKSSSNGFTLVELIVVLVILAILMAIVVPGLLGYIRRGKETAAILECRQIVTATQVVVLEAFEKGEVVTGDELLRLHKEEIFKLAEVEVSKGTIKKIIFADEDVAGITTRGTIKQLTYYLVPSEITVIYDINETPIYQVVDDSSIPSNVPGYMQVLSGVTEDELAKIMKDNNLYGNKSRALQIYMEKKMGGNLPTVTDEEKKKLLNGLTGMSSSWTGVWKPIRTADGKNILVADTKSNNGNAYGPIIYYNGNYYYHNQFYGDSGTNKVSNVSISDLNFDTKYLTEPTNQKPGQDNTITWWTKIE